MHTGKTTKNPGRNFQENHTNQETNAGSAYELAPLTVCVTLG